MSIKNCYPQFPEIPYERTSVEMTAIVVYAKTLVGEHFPKEVVKGAYCIFRNESANGKSGVNNNYGGIQADDAKWEGLDLTNVVGTCIKKDGDNEVRRFIAFNSNGYKASFSFLCYKVQQRGIYIGANGVKDAGGLAEAYQKKWVSNPPEDTPEARKDFKSLYNSADKVFG